MNKKSEDIFDNCERVPLEDILEDDKEEYEEGDINELFDANNDPFYDRPLKF